MRMTKNIKDRELIKSLNNTSTPESNPRVVDKFSTEESVIKSRNHSFMENSGSRNSQLPKLDFRASLGFISKSQEYSPERTQSVPKARTPSTANNPFVMAKDVRDVRIQPLKAKSRVRRVIIKSPKNN